LGELTIILNDRQFPQQQASSNVASAEKESKESKKKKKDKSTLLADSFSFFLGFKKQSLAL
jgi:hypothetical protein